MKVTILGCGSSSGLPVVGSGWGECDPNEPRNRRQRASILVSDDATTLLVDASPDCRAQLLSAEVHHLDAVLFTHAHADHCHGIDDLRWINVATGEDLPAYGNAETLAEIDRRFAYVFETLKFTTENRYYKPVLSKRRDHGAVHGQEHRRRTVRAGPRLLEYAGLSLRRLRVFHGRRGDARAGLRRPGGDRHLGRRLLPQDAAPHAFACCRARWNGSSG